MSVFTYDTIWHDHDDYDVYFRKVGNPDLDCENYDYDYLVEKLKKGVNILQFKTEIGRRKRCIIQDEVYHSDDFLGSIDDDAIRLFYENKFSKKYYLETAKELEEHIDDKIYSLNEQIKYFQRIKIIAKDAKHYFGQFPNIYEDFDEYGNKIEMDPEMIDERLKYLGLKLQAYNDVTDEDKTVDEMLDKVYRSDKLISMLKKSNNAQHNQLAVTLQDNEKMFRSYFRKK